MRTLLLGLSIAFAVVAFAASALSSDKGDRAKWKDHMGDVPFVLGSEDGMKEVTKTGKPPLFFFTADY
jgi:hypothetical protein